MTDPRIAWANATRLAVTRPDALNEDGSLNQLFFKPKRVVYATEKAKWNDQDWENLYKGIEKYGIDPTSWKKIIEEFCPGRDVLFIRIKASRAIGSQGLNRYHGWIGTKEEVKAEYERNKAIGLAIRGAGRAASSWRTITVTPRPPFVSETRRRRPRGSSRRANASSDDDATATRRDERATTR